MTLQQWADNDWLVGHETSRQEIANLLKIVDRDLQDAREAQVSNDWRFGIHTMLLSSFAQSFYMPKVTGLRGT